MRKRTTTYVETSLVSQAAHVLGTHGTTETVHAAMEEVVRRARRTRLAARDFLELTADALIEMRHPGSAN